MSIDVILQGELVTSVKPGDRVQMIGIYRIVPGIFSKERGIFKPVFICLSVEPLYKVTMPKNISIRTPAP
jgi:DNA replicative helicase MCM subunit Mcm2 (Cdc46/Mcm family)